VANERRSAYRKNLKVGGTLISDDLELPFFTKNISLDGFQAYINEAASFSESLLASKKIYVRLPALSLEGEVSLSWVETDANGVFRFGFKFLDMRGTEGNSYRYQGTSTNSDPVSSPTTN
jgi:hypothetical protein